MTGDAREITIALGGKWHGRYGVAFCPAHANTKTPALSLKNAPDGRLLAYCHAGCSFTEIAQALRGRGLGGVHEPDPAAVAAREAADRLEAEKKRRQAARCWHESQAGTGTLVERYLRNRAIKIAVPDTLRFHPECWCGPVASKLPAMVAAVTAGDQLVGVHRTYLAEPGRKADLEKAKLMLGTCRGGAVRLSVGSGPLVVTEGIENGLSLVDELSGTRVWAALSASGLAALILPLEPAELVIAPDGDPAGLKAAADLARRATALGWRVRIMQPPGEKKDWNDVAQEAAHECA
ncbi:MAG: toprim domain-containing protein [Pseudomonadota bacterium]